MPRSPRGRRSNGPPGSPRWATRAWAADPRFARKPDRVANWDALHALMSDWSRQHDKRRIATLAQEAHVPSFPLLEVGEHLDSAQLRHRGFFRLWNGVRMPNVPFGAG